MFITLANPQSPIDRFNGEVSMLNMWSLALSEVDIRMMASNCSRWIQDYFMHDHLLLRYVDFMLFVVCLLLMMVKCVIYVVFLIYFDLIFVIRSWLSLISAVCLDRLFLFRAVTGSVFHLSIPYGNCLTRCSLDDCFKRRFLYHLCSLTSKFFQFKIFSDGRNLKSPPKA